jgi:hypothetical protein
MAESSRCRTSGRYWCSAACRPELHAAVNSGVPGGLAGFFVDHGVPEANATMYAEDVRHGGYVVVVHTDGGEAGERAEAILARPGRRCPDPAASLTRPTS